MDYPILNYETLNLKSDYFTDFLPVIEEISTLAIGGYKLKPENYLLVRDQETDEIRSKRLEKFAPRNYLGAAIKLQRTKQNSGDLNVDSTTLPSIPGSSNAWNNFLEDVDQKGTEFKEYIIKIFESALINKIAYVQIELPYIGLSSEQLNQAQVEELRKRIDPIPKLIQIDPQNILSESESAKGFNLNWIKYKRVVSLEDPFSSTKYNLEFILIDDQNITIWKFFDVLLDSNNEIIKIYDPTYDGGKGGYRRFIPKDDMAIPVTIPHNRDSCPVLKFQLEDSLWMANMVYRAQKIIYGLCTNLIHTICNAGFVQKWGRPYSLNGGGVGGASFSPLTKSALAEINKNIGRDIGDESLLWMDTFQFEELQGTSVTVQQAVIDDLKNFIFTTIALNQTLIEPGDTGTPASGVAKQMDSYLQNVTLLSHGSQIVNFSKDLLQGVAIAFGVKQKPLLDQISVSGMNRFDFKPVSESLDTVKKVSDLPREIIPPALLAETVKQLTTVLMTNHTYDTKKEVLDSIDGQVEKYYNGTSEFTNDGNSNVPNDKNASDGLPTIDPQMIQKLHKVSNSNDAAIAIQ